MLKHSARQVRGFSLIEVLVALVVLSIGLMGIASMQVVGLQFNQQALTTTRAVELAADMADRIRANPGATNDITTPGDAYNVGFAPPSAAPATNCSDRLGNTVGAFTACSNVQLARYDIWEWKTTLQAATGSGLADGLGAVTYTWNADRQLAVYVIDISWSERGETAHYVVEVRQ